ncbi:MAG: hypothetical protein V4733_03920 [Verrucomicrobiota bacterium]
MRIFLGIRLAAVVVPGIAVAGNAGGQTSTGPRVVIPTGASAMTPSRPAASSTRIVYPWRTYVTSTVFWIGETPTVRNRTPNDKSSWDQNWIGNFGGFDDPAPAQRIASHAAGEFRPKAFVPKLNPFYVALPYNDVQGWGRHKPEASRVIPWFARMRPEPGKTVCKGRWVQIFRGGRSCYAQWEDCGPWVTDDWEFVFGNKPPKTTENGAAGIDISPAVRDYLLMKSGDKVHWRFVEEAQVPPGPWKKYGCAANSTVTNSIPGKSTADIEADRRRLENLRKLRDEEFARKPLPH